MSKQNLQRANYALEEWAQWALSSDGYPPTSAIENLGKPSARSSDAPLPHGVEFPNREVANVIYVFHKMIEAGDKSAQNCQLIRAVMLMRKENESIKEFCRRVCNEIGKDSGFSFQKYHKAIKEFAARLDML